MSFPERTMRFVDGFLEVLDTWSQGGKEKRCADAKFRGSRRGLHPHN